MRLRKVCQIGHKCPKKSRTDETRHHGVQGTSILDPK